MDIPMEKRLNRFLPGNPPAEQYICIFWYLYIMDGRARNTNGAMGFAKDWQEF